MKSENMLVGLIADTHIDDRSLEIPNPVFKAFKNVDLIIHAGDLTSIEVIEKLEKIAPVIAIQGNMDKVYRLNLPKRKVIDLESLKVGVIHGEVYPKGDLQQLNYIAQEMAVDVLIYGHSHKVAVEKQNNILFVNPGSPTVPVLTEPTVILMEINKKKINIHVVKVGEPVCTALNFKKDE